MAPAPTTVISKTAITTAGLIAVLPLATPRTVARRPLTSTNEAPTRHPKCEFQRAQVAQLGERQHGQPAYSWAPITCVPLRLPRYPGVPKDGLIPEEGSQR